MSTSLLYHGFDIRGYRYVRTEYVEGGVVFTIVQDPKTCRCPACGGRNIILKGGVVRRFRTLPIGSKKVTLVFRVPRIKCHDCNAVRQTPIAFADPRRTYTRSFAQYVLELAKMMTIRDVALHLGVSWDVVKEIVKNDLQRRFGKPKLRHLRQIAIDEISIGKGHRYLTVVLDLETGMIVHVGHGKGGDALVDFWKRLHRCGAKIEAIATDMSPAYIDAVMTHLPNAVLVFDRFHVMKLFHEKLSDLRRDLYRAAKDGLEKNVLKGSRWLLLKRPENLDACPRTRCPAGRELLACASCAARKSADRQSHAA
jgi:transposase